MTSPSNPWANAIPWLLLGAGLIVRLAVAPLGAHPGDFATLTGWIALLGRYSLLDIYRVSDANYPPLAMAVLAASRALYGLIASGDPSGPGWMILLKLPAILADTGIGWIIWRIAARRGAPSWIVTVTAFNPALIYLSAWWGQYESLYMLAALAALTEALDGHASRAGLWLGGGLMVKLQAGVVLPIVLFALISRQGLAHQRLAYTLRFVMALALPIAVCLGPYAASGQLEVVLLRLVALVSSPGWLTVNALNVWYLVTGGVGNWGYNAPLVMPDSGPVAAGLSARNVGLILLALWTCAVLGLLMLRQRAEIGRADRVILQAAALLYLGIFLWPTQAHERYAFGAVVLMAASAAQGWQPGQPLPRVWLGFGALTVLHTLNLLWAAPFSPALLGWFAGNPTVGIGIAAAFVAAAGWSLRWLVLPKVQSFCPL